MPDALVSARTCGRASRAPRQTARTGIQHFRIVEQLHVIDAIGRSLAGEIGQEAGPVGCVRFPEAFECSHGNGRLSRADGGCKESSGQRRRAARD